MEIKSIRFVYEVKTFYMNRKQVSDETPYVTKDLVAKSFRALNKEWQSTAFWVHYESLSVGYLYDNREEWLKGILTRVTSTNNGLSTDTTKISLPSAKREVYRAFSQKKDCSLTCDSE